MKKQTDSLMETVKSVIVNSIKGGGSVFNAVVNAVSGACYQRDPRYGKDGCVADRSAFGCDGESV